MAAPNPEPVFVQELADKYKCSICTNLLDTPVLTECCGQHFCKACLEKWITQKKESICPHCRAENFHKIVSQPIIREIKELGVYCTNRDNGCKEVINYGDFQKHADECPFGVVECTNDCGIGGLPRKYLEQHCKQECPNRLVHCELCKEEVKYQEILLGQHKRTCPNVILACPNRCHEKIRRRDIEEHKNECPLQFVDCPFIEAGCEVMLPRKDISEHETSNMQSHLRLAMRATATAKELKRDFETLISVVSTGLSSMDILPNDTAPTDGIRTMLTSLTTMIQPDGKPHCVHMSNKLGIFRHQTIKFFSSILCASSPPLCIYPGFKICLAFCNDDKHLLLLLEKSDIHGYPKTLSIEVQPTTGQPFSFSLNDLQLSKDIYIHCDRREFRFMMGGMLLPVQASNDFYVNIIGSLTFLRAETT